MTAPSVLREAAGRTSAGQRRLVGLDVTRAAALIGVVVMNYHGYLNGAQAAASPGDGFAERLFDPWQGVLGTRFAATFVLVAGMGVTLMTDRARHSGDAAAITDQRWRLVRRGALLYIAGLLLDEWWPGTILLFYGAYFVIAAALFTARTRTLIAVATGAAVAAAGLELWRVQRAIDGHSTAWLDTDAVTPRGLALRTLVGSTHPLLPWLAFFCAGIALGRFLGNLAELRWRWAAAGALAVGLTYGLNAALLDRTGGLGGAALSTRPFDRGLAYTVGTLGSSVVAFCVLSWLAERWASTPPVIALQRAGQMTLTLYVAHVMVFKALVDWGGYVRPTGLDTALALALSFWVVAVIAAAAWYTAVGQGPLERLYRTLTG